MSAQGHDGVDRPFLFQMSHALAVDQTAVHDQHFEEPFVYRPRHLFE